MGQGPWNPRIPKVKSTKYTVFWPNKRGSTYRFSRVLNMMRLLPNHESVPIWCHVTMGQESWNPRINGKMVKIRTKST